MIGLFLFGLLGDPPVVRIAQTRHQLVVVRLGAILLLLQPVQHDVWIGDPLEPRQAFFHFAPIGVPSGRRGDPLGPAGGVMLFLIRELHQDVAALGI